MGCGRLHHPLPTHGGLQAGGQIDCSYQHGHQTAAFGVHRFALVLTGSIRVQPSSCDPETKPVTLPANHYVSLHPGFSGSVTAGQGGAELVVYERRHAESGTASPGSAKDSSDLPPLGGSALIHGSVEDSPELDTGAHVPVWVSTCMLTPCMAVTLGHVVDRHLDSANIGTDSAHLSTGPP